MKIAIIGSNGVVGSTLVEHFHSQQHTVLCVDRTTELTLEQAARVAEIVFIVTLPIEEVGLLFSQAIDAMHPGTLLIHGTSIECPAHPHAIDTIDATKKGLTVCHCHFHFRPERPLRRTLFGQNVSLSFAGCDQEKWLAWIENEFSPFQPIMHHLVPEEHDRITSMSQLVHMVTACMIGSSWKALPPKTVLQGINIGGPPCRFLVRSVLRTVSSGKVVNNILLNHPFASELIASFHDALEKIGTAVTRKDAVSLATILDAVRDVVDPQTLKQWDESTGHLIRLEADMQRTVATFRFTAKQNRTGLLAQVLHEFDVRNIDKTSTIAQVTPDGGCIIMIGVKENNSTVQEAKTAVEQLLV